jgi:hypothetical protein
MGTDYSVTAFRLNLGPAPPPVRWVPGAFSPGIKWIGREANHSPPPSTEIKNACKYTRVYPKVSGLSHNEIYAYNSKHSFRSNIKGYGVKTHWTDSQNSDTTAPSGRELYHLQFSLQAASPEIFGHTLLLPLPHSSAWHGD